MDRINFSIAQKFSRVPGPRYIREGHNSGELLRTTQFAALFNDSIRENKMVVVDLDGTLGYGTSFLEEIFGGLIRDHHLDYNQIISHLDIISEEEPYLIDDINHYLAEANEKTAVTA